ncbi:MAG: ABC transporter substrate-binding protein [Beijerinckiaceae bacterium]|nr:ABC transporter substrate-binding protein [Beijerinckiaceae bacterium]MDO9441606.1 ABC transporter substrate-binding protein [Beijerinckiaceae bacterium]
MTRLPLFLMTAALTLAAPLAQAQQPVAWRNGYILNSDAGMLQMSEKGGFAAAQGIAIETVNLRGDPLLLKSLLSGQLESYIGGPASPMVAASKGADVKIVGCGWHKQSYILWGGPGVKDVKDLRGKTIGISTPGSAPDIFIRAAMATEGVSANEVKFVAAGMPSDWLKSMSAGVIDAAATPDEYSVRGQAMGLKVMTTSDKATPMSMQRCYYTTGATLKQHPERVAKFLAAEMAAYTFALKNRDETIKLARRLVSAPADAPEPAAAYDSVVSRNVIETSFEPPMEKLRWLRDVLAENKLLDRAWDPEAMIDRRPLLEARKIFAAAGTKAEEAAPAALAASGGGALR